MFRFFYNWWYKKHPPEMVRYHKGKEQELAYVTYDKDGAMCMQIKGEKYLYPGFPRGPLLFSKLSKLKHNIKNGLFNAAHQMIEDGMDRQEIAKCIKPFVLTDIAEMMHDARHVMLPIEKCCVMVREIHRALSKIEQDYKGDNRKAIETVRKALVFILQEDDGYRFRVQWLANYMPKRTIIWTLDRVINAEVQDDMKGRIKLLQRIIGLSLENKGIAEVFNKFIKRVKWNRIKLTKRDKYFFRAKWFKCDHDKYDY